MRQMYIFVLKKNVSNPGGWLTAGRSSETNTQLTSLRLSRLPLLSIQCVDPIYQLGVR